MKKKLLLLIFVVLVGGYIAVRPMLQVPVEDIARVDLDPAWKTDDKNAPFVRSLFVTKCHYLGRGKQCEAYETADNQYVIKLIRQKPIGLKPKFASLPDWFPFLELKSYIIKDRIERKRALFQSFLLAYQKIPEQTGIIFVHLAPTHNMFKPALFIDPFENPMMLDLDHAQFVVQKKAKLLKPMITAYMENGEIEKAKLCVDHVFELLFECIKQGVFDLDTGLIRRDNIGLLEDRAIYIDTGKLRYMPLKVSKEAFTKDLNRLKPLYRWLLTNYPELAGYYEIREKHYINAF